MSSLNGVKVESWKLCANKVTSFDRRDDQRWDFNRGRWRGVVVTQEGDKAKRRGCRRRGALGLQSKCRVNDVCGCKSWDTSAQVVRGRQAAERVWAGWLRLSQSIKSRWKLIAEANVIELQLCCFNFHFWQTIRFSGIRNRTSPRSTLNIGEIIWCLRVSMWFNLNYIKRTID